MIKYKDIPPLSMDDLKRFFAKFEKGRKTQCWIWQGASSRNYGVFSIQQKNYYAHRVSWWVFRGEQPAETIDHYVCRNKLCVNPAHLEVVSLSENTKRARALDVPKEFCINGHPFDEENTWIATNPKYQKTKRQCRACARQRDHLRYEARKAKGDFGFSPGFNSGYVLSPDDVRELRRLHAEEGLSYRQLAERYSMSPANVSLVVRRKTYKHID